MRRRLAITGVDGFVGRHVASLAAQAGHHVVGIGRGDTGDIPGVAEYIAADLAQPWPTLPDVDGVVHLAALAAVGPSFDEPLRYIDVNAAITVHMCDWLLGAGHPVRVVVASTGALYAASRSPISEDAPLTFASPYAVSKATVEHLASYYTRRGLDLITARPFNHIGPGQAPGFIVPDLVQRLDALEPGSPLPTGNLEAERDYTDVRDVAAAYLLLINASGLRHRVYNVASGEARSGHAVLAAICAAMGRDVPPVTMDRSRPLDVPHVVGDASRLRDELRWSRRYDFERSVADAVAAQRAN